MIELRSGTRIVPIGAGMRVYQPRVAAAAANWWDPNGDGLCIWAAYQPKGAASYAASLTDLSGNGNDASTGVQPDWDAVNGWKFNGSTHYLTTTFVPQNDQSQSMIIQYTNCQTLSVRVLCGIYDGGGHNFFFYPYYTNNMVYYGNGAARAAAPGLVVGNLCVAGSEGYRNGGAEGLTIPGWGGAPTSSVIIGGRNESGVSARHCQYYCQAFALYDCTLTSGQVSAVAAAMAAL